MKNDVKNTFLFNNAGNMKKYVENKGHFFFRSTVTLCSDCALTISDIAKRFFPSNREKNVRNRFFNFVTWSAEKPDKVENYRFLENYSMDFDENQAAWSLFDTLSAQHNKSAEIKI